MSTFVIFSHPLAVFPSTSYCTCSFLSSLVHFHSSCLHFFSFLLSVMILLFPFSLCIRSIFFACACFSFLLCFSSLFFSLRCIINSSHVHYSVTFVLMVVSCFLIDFFSLSLYLFSFPSFFLTFFTIFVLAFPLLFFFLSFLSSFVHFVFVSSLDLVFIIRDVLSSKDYGKSICIWIQTIIAQNDEDDEERMMTGKIPLLYSADEQTNIRLE